jgi:hypothetical protein
VPLEPAERLGEVEVVAVLLAVLFLALADLGDQVALGPHALAECPDEVGVFGEALDEDRAGAVERRGDVGDVLVQVTARRLPRVSGRVGKQELGEGLKAVLAGDLRLGPALRLVRQVEVFQAGLGLGGVDAAAQLVGELALLLDRGQDRGPALLEFPEVAEALVQGPQLSVVEGAGGLLAVPRDERDGRPAIEQVNGGGDLVVAHGELGGDPLDDAGGGRGGIGGLRGGRRGWLHCHGFETTGPT